MLALPTVALFRGVFLRSCVVLVTAGAPNMDLPISWASCLGFRLSLYDTILGGAHAYFDAATSLLFFLRSVARSTMLCGKRRVPPWAVWIGSRRAA